MKNLTRILLIAGLIGLVATGAYAATADSTATITGTPYHYLAITSGDTLSKTDPGAATGSYDLVGGPTFMTLIDNDFTPAENDSVADIQLTTDPGDEKNVYGTDGAWYLNIRLTALGSGTGNTWDGHLTAGHGMVGLSAPIPNSSGTAQELFYVDTPGTDSDANRVFGYEGVGYTISLEVLERLTADFSENVTVRFTSYDL